MMKFDNIINSEKYDLNNKFLINNSKETFKKSGVLTLPFFLNKNALNSILLEAKSKKDLIYFTKNNHNVYLTKPNSNLGKDHPFNIQILSSKGCITTNQLQDNSLLKIIYKSKIFKKFISSIINKNKLYEYADPLSSINIHYAYEGQELGWHFDNSSFAITLLLQSPINGGNFEFVPNLINSSKNDLNFNGVKEVLDGKRKPKRLEIFPGTLVLFQGKDAIHRVSPTIGNRPRILVVLAYNLKPNISLSKEARMTFYGRLE